MLRAILFLLSLCCSMNAFADAQDDAKQQMKAGVKLLNAEKYTEAILAFQRALDFLPEASGPHREMGKCYQRLGRYDEAINHYTEYLTKKPEAEERADIERNIASSRQKLKAAGRGVLSVQTTPAGATVYALTDKGERRGLGVSPINEHPLELRFIRVVVVSSGRPPFDAALNLLEGQAASLSLEIPMESAEPLIQTNPTSTPTSEPAGLEASFVRQANMLALKEIQTVEEERKEPPIVAYSMLGVSGASAITGGILAVGFFQTTREMNEKIESINDENEAQVLAELTALDDKARSRALLIDISVGVAVLSGVVGGTLYFQGRRFEKKSSLVQISPAPNGVMVGGSF